MSHWWWLLHAWHGMWEKIRHLQEIWYQSNLQIYVWTLWPRSGLATLYLVPCICGQVNITWAELGLFFLAFLTSHTHTCHKRIYLFTHMPVLVVTWELYTWHTYTVRTKWCTRTRTDCWLHVQNQTTQKCHFGLLNELHRSMQSQHVNCADLWL